MNVLRGMLNVFISVRLVDECVERNAYHAFTVTLHFYLWWLLRSCQFFKD